jgi:aspartate/methionine/tyrosine aminotransferase
MAQRTVTAFSLSKSYAMAGLRLGYVVADPKALAGLRKMVNHAIYNVPVALQRAGVAALEGGEGWLRATIDGYRAARDLASERAPAPHFRPEGGAYLFLDLGRWLPEADEDRVWALHEKLLEAGVALAPGLPFGAEYARHARLCYTAVPLDRLGAGLDRLAELLETLPHHG